MGNDHQLGDFAIKTIVRKSVAKLAKDVCSYFVVHNSVGGKEFFRAQPITDNKQNTSFLKSADIYFSRGI